MRILFPLLSLSTLLWGAERGWNSLELAKAYFYHSEPQRTWAWELLGQFHLKGAEKILDFGCGDGKITAEVARLAPFGKVTGVDFSSDMIRLATIHFPKTSYENLEFIQTKSETFEEISDMYDVIMAFSVFHFVDQPVEILRHFHAHLLSGGRLLLTIPFPLSSAIRQVADECFLKYDLQSPWHHPGYSNKLSMRTVEGCQQKLEEAGYEILFMQKVETPSMFHDLSEWIDWLIGTFSANWGIPFPMSRSFFTDFVQRMIKLEPTLLNQEGCVAFPQPRIHVIATPRI